MQLAPDKPYEIMATPGAGGMGEVYRLERTVAIKILSQRSSDPAPRQRSESDAEAISCLNHPHLWQYDVTADGLRVLVTEPNSPSWTVPPTLVTNWNAEKNR